MKTLTLKLPDALEARLRLEAQKAEVSKSEVVRRALQDYFSGNGSSHTASFLELAKDLAGSVEGPVNLSTCKEYMEGYGQ